MNSSSFDIRDASLTALSRRRALETPDANAYIYPGEEDAEDIYLTYADLDLQARSLAAALQSRGAAGERVLLFYLPGPEFMIGLLACLYADAIGVPLFPPRAHRSLERILDIITDSRPRFALTDQSMKRRVADLCSREPSTSGLTVLSLADATSAENYRDEELTFENIA